MSFRTENKTIEDWINSLRSGNTIRLNVIAFNEFMEVFTYFNPDKEIEKSVDFNMITFKLK